MKVSVNPSTPPHIAVVAAGELILTIERNGNGKSFSVLIEADSDEATLPVHASTDTGHRWTFVL